MPRCYIISHSAHCILYVIDPTPCARPNHNIFVNNNNTTPKVNILIRCGTVPKNTFKSFALYYTRFGIRGCLLLQSSVVVDAGISLQRFARQV